MSHQNNDNNPPQPSPQNIQGVQNTQGPIGTANTAGNVTGGVGNTNINVVQEQGDKERLENDIRKLRSELTAKENEEKRRKDKVQKLELEIGKLKVEVEKFQQQTYGEREDKQCTEKKICELKNEVKHHNDEIARLENDIQGLNEKIRNDEIELGVLKSTVKDTANAIPDLEKQVRDLMQDMEKYVTDVKAEKESIAVLHRLMEKIEAEQAKQKLQFEDEQREKEELKRKMQNIEDEQAKQKLHFQDDRREREELQRQIQNLHKVIEEKDKVIEEKDKVIEEKDKDIRQLKDARAAAEKKVQEPQDAVQEKNTQYKHGREERKKGYLYNWLRSFVFGAGDFKTGPTYQQAGDEADQHGASSDVEDMGTTATVRAADDSVPRQGVTQKDSNPRHVAALLDACCGGNMAEVKRVLDRGQVDINCRGGGSLTPVMMAAVGGHRDVVELLLNRGADVSLVDEDGDNTLHYACGGGDVGTVELILSQDVVDVNARNNDGETAADRARVMGHHQLADLLVSRAAR